MKALYISLLLIGIQFNSIGQTKYLPKYLQEDDKAFKAIAKRMTPTGWIEFDENAKIARDSFPSRGRCPHRKPDQAVNNQ